MVIFGVHVTRCPGADLRGKGANVVDSASLEWTYLNRVTGQLLDQYRPRTAAAAGISPCHL